MTELDSHEDKYMTEEDMKKGQIEFDREIRRYLIKMFERPSHSGLFFSRKKGCPEIKEDDG